MDHFFRFFQKKKKNVELMMLKRVLFWKEIREKLKVQMPNCTAGKRSSIGSPQIIEPQREREGGGKY